jgi:hypothetical protein
MKQIIVTEPAVPGAIVRVVFVDLPAFSAPGMFTVPFESCVEREALYLVNEDHSMTLVIDGGQS